MTGFDDLIELYEKKEGIQSLLFEMVEEVLSEPPPALKKTINENKKGKQITLRVPEIQIDPSWVSNEAEALNPSSYEKFKKVISAMGLPSDIRDINVFTKAMQSLLTTPISVIKHSEAISRVQVLRVLFNLVKTSAASNAGFTFERFLAMVFNGTVEPPEDPGIVDVSFTGPDAQISAKFLTKDRPNIKGSIPKLMDSLEALPVDAAVTYLVGLKPNMKNDMILEFYMFDVTRKNIMHLPGVNNKDLAQRKGRFVGRNIDRFEKFNLRKVGTIDLTKTVAISQGIMQALDDKFKGLLRELQSLIGQVDDLVYSAPSPRETKKKAGLAKRGAEETAAAAGEIEKSP